jgi:hypothetical protein
VQSKCWRRDRSSLGFQLEPAKKCVPKAAHQEQPANRFGIGFISFEEDMRQFVHGHRTRSLIDRRPTRRSQSPTRLLDRRANNIR